MEEGRGTSFFNYKTNRGRVKLKFMVTEPVPTEDTVTTFITEIRLSENSRFVLKREQLGNFPLI